MKASVVITVYNDDLRLNLTLCGWAGQTNKNFELIVVNDGGDNADRTKDLVCSYGKHFDIHYTYLGPSKKELGGQVFRLAAARNRGLRIASNDLCIISDCDTVPAPDLIHQMLSHYKEDRVIIGIRKRIPERFVAELKPEHFMHFETLAHSNDPRVVRDDMAPYFLRLKDTVHPGSWILCWGCLFAAPLKHFKALGGFDERFIGWGAEDEDMGERLVKGAGCKFLALPEAVVYHLDHPKRDPHPYKAYKTLEEIRKDWTAIRNGGPIK